MSLELEGRLIVKGETQAISERFSKREFVVELTDDVNGNTYTNYAKMQLVQNKCDLLDNYHVGDTVKASFNIKGNKWEKEGQTNYITSLDVWRMEKVENMEFVPPQPAPLGVPQSDNNNADDLPF